MSSYQYRKSHCGDKTIVKSSYLYNGISYTGKMASLYWTKPCDQDCCILHIFVILKRSWVNGFMVGYTLSRFSSWSWRQFALSECFLCIHILPGTVFTKVCLFSLSWKTTAFWDTSQWSFLYKFHFSYIDVVIVRIHTRYTLTSTRLLASVVIW